MSFLIERNKILLCLAIIIFGSIIGFVSTTNITLYLLIILSLFIGLFIMSLKLTFVRFSLILYIFITILIPKAGLKIADLPFTLSNIALIIALFSSFIYVVLNKKKIRYKSTVSRFVLKYYLIMITFICLFLLISFMSHGIVSTLVTFVPNYLPLFLIAPMYFFLIKDFKSIKKALVYSSVILVVYGTIQLTFGHYQTIIPGITVNYSDYLQGNVFESKNNVTSVGLKLVSTYQNGNLYGSILIFISVFFVVNAINNENTKKQRLFYFLMFCLAIINEVASLSRSALIGFVMALIVLACFVGKFRKYLVVSLIAGISSIYLFNFDERIFSGDATGAGRTFMYQDYFQSILNMNWFETIKFLFMGEGIGFDWKYVGASTLYSVESGLLNLILYSGLTGLILYISPLVYLVIKLFLIKKSISPIVIIVISSLIGMWFQFSIDQLMNLPPSAQNYWILLTIGLVFLNDSISKQENEK